jgi:hypothetical protein
MAPAAGYQVILAISVTSDWPEKPEYARLNVGNDAAVGPAYDHDVGKENDWAPPVAV